LGHEQAIRQEDGEDAARLLLDYGADPNVLFEEGDWDPFIQKN